MKPAALGPLVLASAFLPLLAGTARAQNWPTSDPSFNPPGEVLATPARAFGTPGQIAITSDFDIDLSYVSETLSGLTESGPSITISPALMFFLIPQLAVGGIFRFSHVAQAEDSESSVLFGPTGSYNIPISERASIFPTLGVSYIWRKLNLRSVGGRTTATSGDIALILKAPVLFHPFPHVFLGFGPVILIDLSTKAEGRAATKTRSFGLTLDLGFWL